MRMQYRAGARLGWLGWLALLVGIDAAFGPFGDAVYLAPIATLFVVLGVPHGAFDLWIFQRAYSGHPKLLFLAGYVLLVISMLGLWRLSPSTAFVAFLALSVHHFGEGDLPDGFPRFKKIVRGAFFVALPLLAHGEAVAPIVRAMGVRYEPSASAAFAAITSIVLAQIPIILHSGWSTQRQVEELIYVATWCIAFIQLPPLVSFGLYFCLWHAVGHLKDLRQRFTPSRADRSSLDWRTWLPYAVAPNLVLLYAASRPQDASTVEDFASFALMLTASLTLPHAVLVTLMRKHTRTPAPRFSGA